MALDPREALDRLSTRKVSTLSTKWTYLPLISYVIMLGSGCPCQTQPGDRLHTMGQASGEYRHADDKEHFQSEQMFDPERLKLSPEAVDNRLNP